MLMDSRLMCWKFEGLRGNTRSQVNILSSTCIALHHCNQSHVIYNQQSSIMNFTYRPKPNLKFFSAYYYLSLGFLVEHRASVARLHYTLCSLQSFQPGSTTVSKLSFLPHTISSMSPSDAQLVVPHLGSTRVPGLMRDVPNRPSQCMHNPSPLPSAYLLSDGFLVGSLPASQSVFLVALFFLAISIFTLGEKQHSVKYTYVQV
ncbi:unnamed protein product [Heterobilharzia americana]|nr:unnamed protein product [Heterobilharzia americana]